MKAILLLLGLGQILSAQSTCAISGTVVDAASAHPVAQAKVFARQPNDDQDNAVPVVRRITNGDGQFCFERLTAGSYRISAQKAGYLEATFGAEHNGPGVPVVVAGRPIVLKIVPQATISGVVIDADGDPISHVSVLLWKRSLLGEGPSSLKRSNVDEQGRFRLWGIAAGTYYLSASPPSPISDNITPTLDGSGHPLREQEVETFYKDALSLKNATPIAVKAGQEVSGIAIAVQRAASRHITGRVTEDVQSGERRYVSLNGPNGGFLVPLEKDGRFHFEGLTAGQYSLYLVAQGRNSPFKMVDLTEGDADGILLELHETLEIKVSAHLEGSKTPIPLDDSELDSEKEGAITADAEDHGSWHFSGLTPAAYRFVLWQNPKHYFVKRVLIDAEPQVGNVIDLRARKAQALEIVLGISTSSVTGQVTNGKAPVPALTIALQDEADHETDRSQGVPAGGQFEIKALAPGKYRIFAFEDFDSEVWRSKDFRNLLVAKSVVIELRDGESRQVAVPLISADESQAALRKIASVKQ